MQGSSWFSLSLPWSFSMELQLVAVYCQGMIPGLLPLVWSIVLMKVRPTLTSCTEKGIYSMPNQVQLCRSASTSGESMRLLQSTLSSNNGPMGSDADIAVNHRLCKPRTSCGVPLGWQWSCSSLTWALMSGWCVTMASTAWPMHNQQDASCSSFC